MDIISFDKLLLKTAFCCMASDGNLDKREIALIKSTCEKSPLFENFNFLEEINNLVTKVNPTCPLAFHYLALKQSTELKLV